MRYRQVLCTHCPSFDPNRMYDNEFATQELQPSKDPLVSGRPKQTHFGPEQPGGLPQHGHCSCISTTRGQLPEAALGNCAEDKAIAQRLDHACSGKNVPSCGLPRLAHGVLAEWPVQSQTAKTSTASWCSKNCDRWQLSTGRRTPAPGPTQSHPDCTV